MKVIEAVAKPPTESVDQRRQRHRRNVLLAIVLPFIGGFLVIVTLTAVAIASGRSATIADIFLTLVVLCPVAVCMLPVYFLLVVLISLMGRANQSASKGLQRLNGLVDGAGIRAVGATNRLAGLTIRWNSAFAYLDKFLFRLFDPEVTKRKRDER